MTRERTWSEWAMYEDDLHKLKQENEQLKEAIKKIHNYIANPYNHDNIVWHMLAIDQMVLNALYGEGEIK